MEFLPRYRGCFFCGPDGDGVKMQMQAVNGMVFSVFTLDEKFQGYDNVAHGGIVTGILDEIMWWTIFVETRKICLTRILETEFLRAVYCGSPYRAEGHIVGQDRRGIHASAGIKDYDGKVAARAKAVFRVAQDIPRDAFAEKLDFLHVSSELKEVLLAALRGDERRRQND